MKSVAFGELMDEIECRYGDKFAQSIESTIFLSINSTLGCVSREEYKDYSPVRLIEVFDYTRLLETLKGINGL